MTARQIHVEGTSLLMSTLKDRLALAKALHRQDYVALHGAAEIAWSGVNSSLAITDPARYVALREATTKFFLKGYGILNRDILKEMAYQQLARKPGNAPHRKTATHSKD